MRKILLLICLATIISCTDGPRFRLMESGRTGIDFINKITETEDFNVLTYEYIYNGAGVGIADLNNDDLPDVVFAGNQVSPRIYLNRGNFRFRDITENFIGLSGNQWYSGVAIADINADGLNDVYLTSTSGLSSEDCRNRLWINQGVKNGNEPVFAEEAARYGIDHDGQSVSAAFFDYDLDGDLDLYVLNNTVTQRMNTNYRPKITNGTALNNDRLFRNEGNGTFKDVTLEAGIVYEGFGLGIATGDINKDGFPDIYISNDYISNDLLYINQGNGTFRNEIRKYMSYQTKSSMGNDMADLNNDGNPEIYTLDMLPETYYRQRQTINGFSYNFYVNDYKYDFEHQYLRNMLHVHNGFMSGELLPFSEIGQMAGISESEWSWSPLFADYDNDGDKDLLIANGFPHDMTDKDWTRYKATVYGSLASASQVIDSAPPIRIPNLAFENTGDLRFVKKTNWIPDIPTFSYGSAFADLDLDGDLDYVSNNLDDKALVLRNLSSERSEKPGFIRIRLKGEGANTQGIGARAEIWCDGRYQYLENFLTRGYASSVEPVLHFGIGSRQYADSVRITWPSHGKVSLVYNIPANSTIKVNEKEAISPKKIVPKEAPLAFERLIDAIKYTHRQTDYVDFFLNQKIIPHKFSQIGPRTAKGDLNGDGMEDLIVGSTNKLPTCVFVRSGEKFREVHYQGLTVMKPYSESDLAVADIDHDGDNDVIAVAGGYENVESDYRHVLYENRHGTFIPSSLPIPQFPASVIRPCDYDHDGNIEFFVGSRVKKGMYPYANHSWMVLNDNGKLYVDSACRMNLGMVTDAVWSDYDNDGWEDLLVARDWNSIIIVKNMKGKRLIPQIYESLEDHKGIWYSLVAGDFDLDGDDDYIAGNLGNNSRFSVSETTPLNLYAIDFDMDGTIDPLMTAYWPDSGGQMKEYPVNYLDELWSQSSYFVLRFRNYKNFSYTGAREFLDSDMMKRMEFSLQVNTTSSCIIWNEGGSFRWENLPDQVQVSPLKKMVTGDFNGDGNPDVLAGGNDHTYDVSTGYYDASKGFLLLGLGREKGFDILPPSRSGILLNGMVESLEFFDGDSPLAVAGINRKPMEVYSLRTK